jgi:hypothetical protein
MERNITMYYYTINIREMLHTSIIHLLAFSFINPSLNMWDNMLILYESHLFKFNGKFANFLYTKIDKKFAKDKN